jgi:hypothetical protein
MVGAFAVSGCGDDTTGAAPDGGGDVTTDVGPDNEQVDSPTDSPLIDSPIEAGPDAAPDVMNLDAGDSGDAFDNYGTVQQFKAAIATARCNNWQPCCPAAGGPYDMNACIGAYENYGWEGNLPFTQTALATPGTVLIDPTKAANCLAAVRAIPCGMQTAAQWSAVTQACTGVLRGTIAIGQSGCNASVECVSGAYCSFAAGGAGVCTALATQGRPCNPAWLFPAGSTQVVEPRPDEICSYLASSNTGLYCDLIDAVGSANYQTCQPLLASGGTCSNGLSGSAYYYDDQACPAAGDLCGDNNKCGGTATYPYGGSGECAYVIRDAGGGG